MVLVDNIDVWKNLLPLTFTRSVADCRVGILTIKEKWELYLNQKIGIEYAVDYLTEDNANDAELKIASHILPSRDLAKAILNLSHNTVLIYGEEEIASKNRSENFTSILYDGEVNKIEYPWHIFLYNDKEIKSDFQILTEGKTSAHISADNQVLGDAIFIESGAKVHCSILNSLTGPIYIGKNAEVMEGSIIRGPFALGENAQLKMGAKIYGATTIGPSCKVGGEVTNSIFFANSNKAHDGYIGNSVIGEWCNLGADTNSSNLKNNYSKVEIYNYNENAIIDTKQQFLGLVMGDHSKSGINTMFNTGTVVGICSNIVGAGFPKKHIPSFSWSISEKTRPYDLDKALETIHIVYARRGKVLTSREENIIRHLHQETIKP